MRIMVDIGHPADVHFYKYFMWEMRRRGHEFTVTARDKDVTLNLLKAYAIEHSVVGKMGNGIFDLVKEWVKRDQEIYSIARRFRPDILTGFHNPCVAHISKLIGAKSIIFTDTEHEKLANMITFPFADVIFIPTCFRNNLGRHQIRYNGYKELAYLHPNYFRPDPSVLGELGLTERDRFVIVRFVAWQATHDIGQHGLDLQAKRRLVEELGKYARILITSESSLPEEFEKYRITVPPERMHDLLYYATLYIGEGATIASECAVLGTPAIYVNTLRLGYLDEQEKRYGLVYNFSDPETAQTEALEKALELLRRENLEEEWQAKRERLLSDKIDVTEFMVKFIENYPESFNEYKSR